MSQFPERPSQQPSQQNYDPGDSNFAGGAPQQPYDQYSFGGIPPEPPRQSRGGLRRTLLYGCGCVTLAVVIVCGCIAVFSYSMREAFPAVFWTLLASANSPLDLDDAGELNIYCPNSQAEAFTLAFIERYGDNVEIELTDNTMISGEENTVGLSGTFTFDEQTLDYEATFEIDPDRDGFVFFVGCIERIDQISPPFSIEYDPGADGSLEQ